MAVLELISSRRNQLEELCRRYHVRSMALFGSALREDFDPARSDIDLRVDFEPMAAEVYADNYFGLRTALVELFGREVDLLSSPSIRNPYFRREIERTQETLYAA